MSLDEVRRELATRLNVHVSQSTISIWLRNYALPEDVRAHKARAGTRAMQRARREMPDRYEPTAITAPPMVFTRERSSRHLRMAAIGAAIDWFMARGHRVSLPVDLQSSYDLVVECDSGFRRVQVKSTSHRGPTGRWVVGVYKTEYDQNISPNAAGRRKNRAYKSDEVDWFFVITAKREIYLIPIDAIDGKTSLSLDVVYKNFRVE